jgi:hypothetical protein
MDADVFLLINSMKIGLVHLLSSVTRLSTLLPIVQNKLIKYYEYVFSHNNNMEAPCKKQSETQTARI